MKNLIRNWAQRILGFHNYLFLFALYCIRKCERGDYEKEFMHFIKLNSNDGIILDIGANIGITVAPFAKYLNRAQIHAYEPISENFSTLGRLVKYLKFANIQLFNMALGNQNGELKMIMPIIANARMQGLSKAFVEGSNEKGVIYNVPLKRLDDLYPEENQIKAIKVDVENFEYEVLKGGIKLLERNKPLLYCELWDNENRTLVINLLTSIGYEYFIFDDELNSLIPMDINQISPSNNFFFIRPN